MALLDFLLGLSVDDVASRYRMSRTTAEDELRQTLLAFGFRAQEHDQ